MSKKIDERITALTDPNIQTTVKIDRRRFNKKSPKSGRKPKEALVTQRGIKAYLEQYFNGDVEIEVTDPNTGKKAMVPQPRILVVLAKLYEIGTSGKGDADALNKWLDRALGKPVQTVKGDEDAPLFKLQVNIANILTKAYGPNGGTT